MKLSGEVKGGRLVIAPVPWAIAMNEFANRRVVVEIEAEKSLRTVRANARYWAVLVPLACHELSKDRAIPLSKDQTHIVLASAFVGVIATELAVVPKDTHTLSVQEFYNFTEEVSAWLANKGYCIPEQGEPLQVGA